MRKIVFLQIAAAVALFAFLLWVAFRQKNAMIKNLTSRLEERESEIEEQYLLIRDLRRLMASDNRWM